MAIKPNTNYPTKTTAPSADYPQGGAQNVTAPGDGTGTPWEEAVANDMFGIFQKLLDAAGVVPSGNPDTVQQSDYFDSLEKLFSRFSVFTDTGAANAVQLAAASGADPAAYVDDQEVEFYLNNTLTGAATLQIAALGAEALELPGGIALTGYEAFSGENIRARYDLGNTRWEIISELSKVGIVEAWPLDAAPAWGLICDGTAVSRTTNASLFERIGITYGNGDGATTFNVPDYRGEFLRGRDNGAGNDPDAAGRTDRGDGTTGDNVGTKQLDAMQGHYQDALPTSELSAIINGSQAGANGYGAGAALGQTVLTTGPPVTDGVNGTPRTAAETRGRNTYINYVIRTRG